MAASAGAAAQDAPSAPSAQVPSAPPVTRPTIPSPKVVTPPPTNAVAPQGNRILGIYPVALNAIAPSTAGPAAPAAPVHGLSYPCKKTTIWGRGTCDAPLTQKTPTGAVMGAASGQVTVTAYFWDPTATRYGYRALIDQYLTDVQDASGTPGTTSRWRPSTPRQRAADGST